MGDLTDETSRRLAAEGVQLDYGIEPVSFGPAGDRIVGVLAFVAVVAAFGLFLWATVTSRLYPGWWLVLLPLVLAGVIIGYAWRVLTAGGIGANIGAGIVITFGGPFVIGLLIAPAVPAVMMWREGRRPTTAI